MRFAKLYFREENSYPFLWAGPLLWPLFLFVISIFYCDDVFRYLLSGLNIADHSSIWNICYTLVAGLSIVSGNYKLVNVITGGLSFITIISIHMVSLVSLAIQLGVGIIVIHQVF